MIEASRLPPQRLPPSLAALAQLEVYIPDALRAATRSHRAWVKLEQSAATDAAAAAAAGAAAAAAAAADPDRPLSHCDLPDDVLLLQSRRFVQALKMHQTRGCLVYRPLLDIGGGGGGTDGAAGCWVLTERTFPIVSDKDNKRLFVVFYHKADNGKSYKHNVSLPRCWFLAHPELYRAKGWTASHLCHCALCVNPAHIFPEPLHINSSRNSCGGPGRCTHRPMCLAPAPFKPLWQLEAEYTQLFKLVRDYERKLRPCRFPV